ncbi:hypothetical protein HAP41_0000030295 [Bradyrhizobium barranii subsp. apii]|uniref:Uncharacterized protein n=1 Tax=Bradyrhizobium barranii subsp. apii TaxID=2819348 RepID=A0A8T5VDR5_9BRAD|nr:hypothetical protein [Bradyrhizobium barranii]UPT84632.1 hypothetical protein HAP41_0000030295 [Bradyrhizobium barranii subsp. apii]UPT93219.1 hypothetical protein J4G48_0027935 [Bradyrhizobium barranii subsp. apii]
MQEAYGGRCRVDVPQDASTRTIILLVFALAQDLVWTGVGAKLLMGLGTALTAALIATIAVSAREVGGRMAKAQAGFGMLAIRAVEVAASVAIVAFGALLMAGYMATEQLWMFSRQFNARDEERRGHGLQVGTGLAAGSGAGR